MPHDDVAVRVAIADLVRVERKKNDSRRSSLQHPRRSRSSISTALKTIGRPRRWLFSFAWRRRLALRACRLCSLATRIESCDSLRSQSRHYRMFRKGW